MRTIETYIFSVSHCASKVVSVTIANDCGAQVKACYTVALSLGGSVTDVALTLGAQSVFQGKMH